MMTRSTKISLAALGLVVLLATACFVALSNFLGAGEGSESQVAARTTVSTTPPASITSPTSSKPTPTLTKSPTRTPTPTPTPTVTSSTSAKASKAQPVRGGRKCGESSKFAGYAANNSTSCGFVNNVATAMDAQAGAQQAVKVQATSEATGKKYEMTCTPEGQGSFMCRGGNRAVVQLLPK